MSISEIRKQIIAVATTIVAAAPWIINAEGIVHLPNTVVAGISLVLGVAGWITHYLTANETNDPSRVEGRSVRLKGTTPTGQVTTPPSV